MPWIGAAIGGAASLAGGAIGAGALGDAREQAQRLAEQSVADLTAIGIPDAQARQIALQKFQSEGQLTPELEQAISQSNSQMGGISTDPNDHQAQLQALSELQNIGQGGVRLSDMTTQNQLMNDVQAKERGSRQAIEQQMREKNQFGGGDELAMKLANQQDAATQANQVGLNTNAQAQDRALQAIMQSGQLGGQMQQQEFNQKAQQASAQDAINQFNAMNQQGVIQRNIANMNTANAANLANKQNISNQNVGLTNQQEIFNKDTARQEMQDKLALAQSKANARAGQASQITAAGNQAAQMAGNVGAGIGTIGMGYTNNQNTLADNQAQRDWASQEMAKNRAIKS